MPKKIFSCRRSPLYLQFRLQNKWPSLSRNNQTQKLTPHIKSIKMEGQNLEIILVQALRDLTLCKTITKRILTNFKGCTREYQTLRIYPIVFNLSPWTQLCLVKEDYTKNKRTQFLIRSQYLHSKVRLVNRFCKL